MTGSSVVCLQRRDECMAAMLSEETSKGSSGTVMSYTGVPQVFFTAVAMRLLKPRYTDGDVNVNPLMTWVFGPLPVGVAVMVVPLSPHTFPDTVSMGH